MHSAVTISLAALILTFPYFLCQGKIPCRYIHSWNISIISASWYSKEPAHLTYGISSFMSVDYHIFYACPHFLSVSERKSRINSFSISNRLMCRSFVASSYCNWESLLNCCTDGGNPAPSFPGLPFGLMIIPSASFCWVLLYLVLKSRISLYVNPYFSPASRSVCPFSNLFRIV